ncbi:hypothetical protein D3C85_1739540 [compost metagenome]
MLDELWNPAKRAIGGDPHADKRGDATGHRPGFGLGLVQYRDDVLGGPFQTHAGRAEPQLAG